MNKKHINYTPTEYEQMLIVAGWITPESCDQEYLKYCGQLGMDAMPYSHWLSSREEWNRLDQAYFNEVQPHHDRHPDGNIPAKVREREEILLRDMMWIESYLGY